MDIKKMTVSFLAPTLRLQAEKIQNCINDSNLREAESELDSLIATASELSRRIRRAFDEEMMK